MTRLLAATLERDRFRRVIYIVLFRILYYNGSHLIFTLYSILRQEQIKLPDSYRW